MGIPAKKNQSILVFMVVLLISLAWPADQAGAFSDQVIQRGATGDDVVELQSRLQYNGYYNGRIDGVYGWSTYWAVRNFQNDFGLEVDGLVGKNMKHKLEKSTEYDEEFVQRALNEGRKFTHYGGTPKDIQQGEKGGRQGKQQRQQQPQQQGAPQEQPQQQGAQEQPGEQAAEEQNNQANIQKAMNVPDGYSENDIQIMANAVYGEARGEPYEGQVAVAAVIINRVNSPTFPNDVQGVIFEPRAFTAVADGQIWLEPNEQARKAVLDAINGQDPSDGATYYFNPDTATSAWIWSRPQKKRIGKHIFCD